MANVTFIREERETQFGIEIIKRYYDANSKNDALTYLQQNPVTKRHFHIEINTPTGAFGRDVEGIYDQTGTIFDWCIPNQSELFSNIFRLNYHDSNYEEMFMRLQSVSCLKAIPDFIPKAAQIYYRGTGDILEAARATAKSGRIASTNLYDDSNFVAIIARELSG